MQLVPKFLLFDFNVSCSLLMYTDYFDNSVRFRGILTNVKMDIYRTNIVDLKSNNKLTF